MSYASGEITSFSETYDSISGPRRTLEVQLRPGAAGGSVGLLWLDLPSSADEADGDWVWQKALLDLTQEMTDRAARARVEVRAARLEAELAELRKQLGC